MRLDHSPARTYVSKDSRLATVDFDAATTREQTVLGPWDAAWDEYCHRHHDPPSWGPNECASVSLSNREDSAMFNYGQVSLNLRAKASAKLVS